MLRRLLPGVRGYSGRPGLSFSVSAMVLGLGLLPAGAAPAAARAPKLPTPGEVAAMKVVDPEKAARLLKEVKVPAGFTATMFATPPAVNYPVFVAAAPDGTLYVSSDGNGSLGRLPHLGRVLRVRDTNGDGTADEVRVFADDIDSPRGLVWDHDRLYLLHPPHISELIDRDGDGVAEERRVLVKNIAFTFKDRPADHTSNGLELGIDGWIYAAIGDFGFMEAEGTDGRRLQLRAGGVVRVRPDGTGLELFARGTRNILEVAVSPLLDAFARDNTNDGGGWDVRLHHFTGLEEHGYPSLYKNFREDMVAPLADYGGGSGCGAAWIDEPGMPTAWNNAPYTADWGRGWIYQHSVKPRGATFEAEQKQFVGFTRPTDLDVDARSHIYAASWKGATFNWDGPDVGYIVRLSPAGFTAAPLPDFARAPEAELVGLLAGPSHRTRLEAQRTLVRRAAAGQEVATTVGSQLTAFAADGSKPLAGRVAAVFGVKQALGARSAEPLSRLAADPSIAPWAIRALADRVEQLRDTPVAPLLAGLDSPDARTRREAVVAVSRVGAVQPSLGARLVPLLTDSDPVIAHTAMQGLVRLQAVEPLLPLADLPGTPASRAAALRTLGRIHETAAVDGLLARLGSEPDAARRRGLLTALCRLHFREGKWKGDSWGTRPDTRGPYYQPEAWAATDRIFTALNTALRTATPTEAVFLAGEMSRHRIDSARAMETLFELAARDASLVPVVVGQLARGGTIPPNAQPLLRATAVATSTVPAVRADAIEALAKSVPDAAAVPVLLQAVRRLAADPGAGADRQRGTDAFLNSAPLEKQSKALLAEAGRLDGDASLWADAALIRMLDRQKDRQRAAPIRTALETGWAEAARRTQLIRASVLAQKRVLGDRILAARQDPDPAIAEAARRAVTALKIPENAAAGNLIGSMKTADVLTAVVATKGDVRRGEQIFAQIGCNTCHTTREGEALKGPFLGTVSTIYRRRELAEAILDPNKSIAQGFAANRFELKNGDEIEGFVIVEEASRVVVRNIVAQEIVIKTGDILRREKLAKSLMPEGLAATLTVADLASLVDYLESLAPAAKP